MSADLASLPLYNPGLPYLVSTMEFLRDPIGFICRGHQQCGTRYRTRYLNKEHLMLGGEQANEFIWSHADLWNYPVSNGFFGEQLGEKYLIQLEGTAHQEKRRRINQALKPATVLPHVPAMAESAFAKINAYHDQECDLRHLCSLVMTHLTATGLLKLKLPSGIDEHLVAFQRDILWARVIHPFRKIWYQLPEYQRSRTVVLNFIRDFLDRELSNNVTANTSLAALLEAQHQQGVPVDREELAGDIALLLMAGADSVGHIILWALIFLDKNPTWTVALREEVESFDPQTFSGMEKLPMLKATILEIERMRPPTVVLNQVSRRAFQYEGLEIPEKTSILHASAITHYLPEYYTNPHTFQPERFLNVSTPRGRVHGTYGGGAHVCAGQFLSRVQAPLVVALFVKYFTWEFLVPISGHAVTGSSLTPREKHLTTRIRRR